VPLTSAPEEEDKRRLVKALEEKGLSEADAKGLVERMWPVLDTILKAVSDSRGR
jgi:hypothetical protein